MIKIQKKYDLMQTEIADKKKDYDKKVDEASKLVSSTEEEINNIKKEMDKIHEDLICTFQNIDLEKWEIRKKEINSAIGLINSRYTQIWQNLNLIPPYDKFIKTKKISFSDLLMTMMNYNLPEKWNF
jgi:seryl-tRNA synthetase